LHSMQETLFKLESLDPALAVEDIIRAFELTSLSEYIVRAEQANAAPGWIKRPRQLLLMQVVV